MAADADIATQYRARAAELRESHAGAVRHWRRLANVRLLAFVVVALAAWWTAASAPAGKLIPALATVVALAAFIMLVRRSTRARAGVTRLERLIEMKEAGIHRIRREWSELESHQWPGIPESHPYAIDLDVFGSASLAQLFPSLSMAPGRSTLASWLLGAAPPDEVQPRQVAIAELKDRVDMRDELSLYTQRISTTVARLTAFEQWCATVDDDLGGRGVVISSFLVPVAALLLGVAQWYGLVTEAYWLIPIALGGAVTMRFRKRLQSVLTQLEGQRDVLRRYADVARIASDPAFNAQLLTRLRSQLLSASVSAERSMRSLGRLAENADVRLSPMLHFIVQALCMWDFHVARALNTWKRAGGAHMHTWMDAIGAFESISALATLAYENPGWGFPVFDPSAPAQLIAQSLGHPLLNAETCIANDVTVGPAGTLLVVSGSNMAGKSTLLRAIGLNVVLAQCGSVVCAAQMRLPSLLLYTSMRVQDSLERGVSYFMAELERLKLIVDAADAVRRNGDATLLFLLDEILHGTNSAERTIAARHVLGRLVASGAIGAVTTHDLALADSSEFAAIATHVHLEEQFFRAADGTPTMRFDYRLRPGKAESTNALKLLELVGLS